MGANWKKGEPLFGTLADDAPALLRSIREARATVSCFTRAFSTRTNKSAVYLVKLPLIDAGPERGVCVWNEERASEYRNGPALHLWLRVHDALDDLLFAHAFEAPEGLKGLSVGQTYVVGPSDIEDWMINVDGLVYGGYSIRIQREALPVAQRPEFDAYAGIGRFSDELP